jgi:hypothetical protein
MGRVCLKRGDDGCLLGVGLGYPASLVQFRRLDLKSGKWRLLTRWIASETRGRVIRWSASVSAKKWPRE